MVIMCLRCLVIMQPQYCVLQRAYAITPPWGEFNQHIFTAEKIGTPNSLYSMATGKRAKGEWEHHGLATLYVSIVRPSLDVRWTPELSSEALDPLADLRTKIKYFYRP